MKNIFKIIAVICLGLSSVFGQSLKINKVYLDSLKKNIYSSAEGKTTAHICNQIAKEYIKIYESDSILFYSRKAIEAAKLYNNKPEEALGYFYYASANRVGYDRRDFPYARKEYYENINSAIKIFDEIGDRKNLAESYLLLGSYYNRFGQPESAFDYYNKTMLIFQSLRDSYGIAKTDSYLGQFFDVNGNPSKAVQYFESSLNTFTNLKDTLELIYTLARYSYCMKSLGRHQEQEDLMYKTYRLAQNCENDYLMADIYCDYGLALLDNKKTDQAIIFLSKGYELISQFKADKLASLIASYLSKAYAVNKEYSEAYKYQQLTSEHQSKYFAKLNNESLEDQKTTLDIESQAKEQKMKIFGLIVISIILAFLLFLLFIINRQKNKANKTLEEKNNIIRDQNEELDIINQQLEKSVAERTEELTAKNEDLIKEVEMRISAEISLQESEKRYRSLIESSPDAIIVQSKDKILYVNGVCLDMLEISNSEELENNLDLFINDSEIRKTISKRKDAILNRNEVLLPIEIRGHKFTGEIIDVEIRSSLINYGGVIAIQSILRDITKRKHAETELRKLSKAVEQSSAAIVITDPEGLIEYVNPRFEEVTGYTISEVKGHTPRVLKSGKMPDTLYQELWATLKAGGEWRGEFLNKKKNGDLFWELCLISPIKDDDGEILNFVAVKEDITERMIIQEELIRSKEEAVEANKLKSTLLSNVSHEFRTPLNGILGFAQILKEILTDQVQSEMAEKISRSGRRLANTLNSVLLLTELENKTFLVSNNSLDLAVFCNKLKNQFERAAQELNLKLVTVIPSKSLVVIADENLLSKLFSALLDNSIKYTREGSITIQLESTVNSAGKENALIKIIDTGIGISSEDQKVIFREFKQLSEGFNRDFEGLGLGLAIVKKLADLAGYEITVKSEFGKGSTFTVQMPIERIVEVETQTEEKPQVIIPDLSKETKKTTVLPDILFVEDNEVNIEVVEHFLSKICVLSSATNGFKAIELVKKKKFQLLLLDINLGKGPDGIDVLEEIRAMDEYRNVPAVALTGYASDVDKKNIIDHGFNDILAKPFTKDDLLKTISVLLNN